MLVAALIVVLLAQQVWIFMAFRRAAKREELFRIITENAADMIALVDTKSHRLYNSPSYERVLGYTPEELAKTPIFEQIHPDDRFKVLEAAREARATGVGKSLQYRLRHKNGEWRTLESTASAIKDNKGEVEKLVIVNRDVTQRVAVEAELAHHALHDALTGLANRRLFLDRLQRCFAQAQRDSDFRYGVLLIDVDSFKSLNRSLGTTVGDQVLIEIGHRLANAVEVRDASFPAAEEAGGDVVVSRQGGDEFAVLLEGCSDPSDVLRLAERIQSAIAQPLVLEQGEIRLHISIGSALTTGVPPSQDALLADAETALRRAQARGGNRSELFDSAMHQLALNRLRLEADLRTALNRGQFRLLYQPVFQIDPQQVVGFEALLRWQHPEKGLISPREFLDAAEDTGLMALIDQWVIREAGRNLSLLQAGTASLYLAVNLSARHFTSPQLLDGLKGCVREAELRPGALQLGITQQVAMANPDLTTAIFSQLKRLEIAIAIDGFGTGTLSLAALRQFSADVLKIDRLPVMHMLADRSSLELIELILMIAGKLNCRVVAQGIERPAQLERLRALGCQFGQGYFFAPPLELEAAQRLLREPTRSQRASAT